MKGSYRVIVQNKKVRYDFEIRRNITVIRGDSATGKTTLVEMIREYYENGVSSGIELSCERICAVLAGRDWESALDTMSERIIFIDEGNTFVHSTEFARAVKQSDNYYVIVAREGLANLPYSVEEIYGIRESGKYATLRQTYNEFYHIYGHESPTKEIVPTKMIVEDSNAGCEFFQGVAAGQAWSVVSANGKSNVFAQILQNTEEKQILVVADGAAFGSEIDRVMKLAYSRKNIALYLPESFEWLILNSGVVDDREVRGVLAAPEEYIESKMYFSWERYFTALLIEKTKEHYLQYTKKQLNPAYLQEGVKEKICGQVEGIRLE